MCGGCGTVHLRPFIPVLSASRCAPICSNKCPRVRCIAKKPNVPWLLACCEKRSRPKYTKWVAHEQRGAELGAGAAGDDAVKSAEDIVVEMLLEVGRRAQIDYKDLCERWMTGIESHIEAVLGSALVLQKIEGISFVCGDQLVPAKSIIFGCDSQGVEWAGAFYCQIPIGSYRPDFYLEVFDQQTEERWFRAIIECDGHEFHERTKSQAARDKRRDRWFQTEGITVLRFTGSEIWRDAIACADQVADAFHAAWRRRLRNAA